MITIQVRYFNILIAFTSCKEETVSFQAAPSLLEIIHFLAAKYPGGFAQVVLQEGKLAPHLRIFINNKTHGWQDGDVLLNDGDEVMLFPAVAGG